MDAMAPMTGQTTNEMIPSRLAPRKVRRLPPGTQLRENKANNSLVIVRQEVAEQAASAPDGVRARLWLDVADFEPTVREKHGHGFSRQYGTSLLPAVREETFPPSLKHHVSWPIQCARLNEAS